MMVDKISGDLMQKGVFMMGWVSHMIIAPPLIASEAELERGLAALDESLRLADAEVN